MNIADIVIVVIFVIFLVIGIFKGFVSLIVEFLNNLLSIIIAYFLCEPLGLFLHRIGIGGWINNIFEPKFLSINDIFSEIVTKENQKDVITEGLSKIKIPDSIGRHIANLIGNIVSDEGGNTLAYYTSNAIGRIICIVVVFILLSLILLIIFNVIRKHIKAINNLPVAGTINRIFGAILNGVIGYVFILAILLLVNYISGFNDSAKSFFDTYLGLNSEKWNLTKWLYEHNIINIIIDLLFRK